MPKEPFPGVHVSEMLTDSAGVCIPAGRNLQNRDMLRGGVRDVNPKAVPLRSRGACFGPGGAYNVPGFGIGFCSGGSMASASVDLAARAGGLAAFMRKAGWDAVVAGPSPNFIYLTGLDLWRSERLIAAVFKPGRKPELVLPAFEAERARASNLDMEIRPWEENDDPYAVCAGLLGRSAVVAVEEKTPFSEFDRLRSAAPGVKFVSAEAATGGLRRRKSAAEAESIRKACRITVARLGEIAGCLEPGMEEQDAASQLEVGGLMQFGPSSAIPHSEPGSNALRERDVVVVDTADVCDHYTSDITRTIFVGEPDEEMVRVYCVVKRAQDAAIAAVKAGVPAGDIDRAARSVIEDEGYGPYFTHRVGHGIGLEVHEMPFMHGGNRDPLVAGDVITIEPGIYLPGRWGVRIEDDVLVTETGSEVLSEREREMTVLEF